jgi:hypothetical protein
VLAEDLNHLEQEGQEQPKSSYQNRRVIVIGHSEHQLHFCGYVLQLDEPEKQDEHAFEKRKQLGAANSISMDKKTIYKLYDIHTSSSEPPLSDSAIAMTCGPVGDGGTGCAGNNSEGLDSAARAPGA